MELHKIGTFMFVMSNCRPSVTNCKETSENSIKLCVASASGIVCVCSQDNVHM